MPPPPPRIDSFIYRSVALNARISSTLDNLEIDFCRQKVIILDASWAAGYLKNETWQGVVDITGFTSSLKVKCRFCKEAIHASHVLYVSPRLRRANKIQTNTAVPAAWGKLIPDITYFCRVFSCRAGRKVNCLKQYTIKVRQRHGQIQAFQHTNRCRS
jgi:hypothetical protein